jgi:hypothetical protein
MVRDIILSILLIIGGFFYLKWLYKRNGGFFLKKRDDFFEKSMTLRGWIGGLLMLIGGIYEFIKVILKLWE